MLQLVPVHQSGGGMSGDGSQSYAATVISAAKVSLVLFLNILLLWLHFVWFWFWPSVKIDN